MSTGEIHRRATRGVLRTDVLEAGFSFSSRRDDPMRRRFGTLIALNDDRVRPATGFPMHPRCGLEIAMSPLAGAIEHHGDRGGHAMIRPGQRPWMRAGRGIRQRQWNPSRLEADHRLQIWLEPSRRGLPPAVETAALEAPEPGPWRVIVSRAQSRSARDRLACSGSTRRPWIRPPA